MKNTHICPKCNSSDIIKIPGKAGPYGNTLSSWKLKKIGIIGTLVAVSVIGALPLVFDLGPKWLIIPVIFILLMIWLLGRKIYACPHCKTPIDLRLHLHTNMKCTKCGKSIMD